MNDTLPNMPAMRHLGDLADRQPTVIVDSREQTPLVFTRLPSIRGTLYTGDYSIGGLESIFAVERKSLPDLASCCVASNRDRFENELHRLRGFRFRRLLIIGTPQDIVDGAYRSQIKPAAVLGTVATFEIRYDCPVVWEPTPEAAARRVEGWAWYYAREHVEAVNGLLRATSATMPANG